MNWLGRFLPGQSAPAPGEAFERWRALPEAELGRPHSDTRYVVVNTEASGLDTEHDRLLAVAAIAVDGGLLNPLDSYHAALEPDPAAALGGLLAFAGKAPLVVFGAAFHRNMLEAAWRQWLGDAPEFTWLDLYWLMPAVFEPGPDGPSRLAQWMKAMDVETFQRHHALGDAWAIAQLFLALQGHATARGAATPRALGELERTRRKLASRA
ncbi:3'-5' exonuclease [Pseudothauera nasutitermitis]|uniref:3'-5' exonuclease n=1 Tax=Pseudothauera nasutitermitis TaxID=2565930 RepID=A0A4S4B2W6_9RHOO|nr:3'-5' exonuclease [Pseudothauera nasutitermitis]THF66990.1 3'-5' exonuclease [Pseudothauera nasutitermitis]